MMWLSVEKLPFFIWNCYYNQHWCRWLKVKIFNYHFPLVGKWSWLSPFLFFICELSWYLWKYGGVVICYLFHGFEFRVDLLKWLQTNASEAGNPLYRRKAIHAMDIRAKMNLKVGIKLRVDNRYATCTLRGNWSIYLIINLHLSISRFSFYSVNFLIW